MTIEDKIQKKAEGYALDRVKRHHSDIHSMAAKWEFVSISGDFKAGANFGCQLGIETAFEVVEKVLVNTDFDDMSWSIDDLLNEIRDKLEKLKK